MKIRGYHADYTQTLQEATDQGMREKWIRSNAKIEKCRHLFSGSDEGCLSQSREPEQIEEWTRGIVKRFGIEIPTLIMAATVQQSPASDPRFDKEKKEWASQFHFPHTSDNLNSRWNIYCVTAWHGIHNRVIRGIQEIERERKLAKQQRREQAAQETPAPEPTPQRGPRMGI